MKLPDHVDLSDRIRQVYDQGELGSSVSCAVASMFQGLFDEDVPITRVVNIRKKAGVSQPCDVRIDLGTDWGNPYSHLPASAAKYRVATREEAIEKYREYIKSRPDLLARLGELEGKTLGCWCKPKSCHGDVLVELINERLKQKRTQRDANKTEEASEDGIIR